MKREVFYSFSNTNLNPGAQIYFTTPQNQQNVFLKWLWIYMANSNAQGMQCIGLLTDNTNGTVFDAVIDDTVLTMLENGLFVATSDKVPFSGRVPLRQGTMYQLSVTGAFISPPNVGGDFVTYCQMVLEFE